MQENKEPTGNNPPKDLPAADPEKEPAAGNKKKKPGRPKKQTVTMPVEVVGIVEKPAIDSAVLELVYCNPNMFKKILILYKQFKASELEMKFDKSGVKIFSKDHLKKSNVYTLIDGRCMNWFYCKMPIRICIKRDSLEKVLSTLGKNNYKITFLLKEENYRSTMYIVIKDAVYEIDHSYELDILFKKPDEQEQIEADDDTNYPIKLRMDSKYFKAQISNIRKISHYLTIQKCGKDNLQLTSCGQTQKVNWTGVCSNEQKLDVKSTISDEELFNVSVCIDYFRPFSNSNLGDEVFLAADKREKISFMTRIDEKRDMGWAATVKVFTEIKDYRAAAKVQ